MLSSEGFRGICWTVFNLAGVRSLEKVLRQRACQPTWTGPRLRDPYFVTILSLLIRWIDIEPLRPIWKTGFYNIKYYRLNSIFDPLTPAKSSTVQHIPQNPSDGSTAQLLLLCRGCRAGKRGICQWMCCGILFILFCFWHIAAKTGLDLLVKLHILTLFSPSSEN